MGHFAKVENGIVTHVIVADQTWIDSGHEGDPNLWIQTSYNTHGGVHYGTDGKPDGGIALRGNYAGIGYVYDKTHDVFYPPRPVDYKGIECQSWTIGAPTWIWQPPIAWPGEDYDWNETTNQWDKNR
jgi:hypothetical protein